MDRVWSLTDGLVSLFIEWAQAGTVPTGRPPVESFDRDPGESTSKSILILAILYHVLSLWLNVQLLQTIICLCIYYTTFWGSHCYQYTTGDLLSQLGWLFLSALQWSITNRSKESNIYVWDYFFVFLAINKFNPVSVVIPPNNQSIYTLGVCCLYLTRVKWVRTIFSLFVFINKLIEHLHF